MSSMPVRAEQRGSGRKRANQALLIVRAVWILCLLLGATSMASAQERSIPVLEINGPITPAIVGYIDRGITAAEEMNAPVVVLQIDTPGGLDDSTRKIMQRIIASDVPVVAYVYPSGGRAASAGLFITEAAHVAAMAPDTNIGSAHPVQLGGGEQTDTTLGEKIENDAVAILTSITQTRGRNAEWVERAVRESVNVSAREAVDLNVVDLMANDYPSLFQAIDGRTVELAGGRQVTIETTGATREPLEMTFAEQFIQTISDPNIAYLLMTIGMYGLIYELANPGGWIGGVIGVVALVVAFYALGTLPVNWAGVALILLAFGLFAADILVAGGHGGLTAAGILTLILGSLFLFSGGSPAIQLSPWAIAGVVGTTTAFFFFVVGAAFRSRKLAPAIGQEAFVGQVARVSRDLAPGGMVEIDGELWRAELVDGAGPVRQGDRVTVVGMEGLTLRVTPLV